MKIKLVHIVQSFEVGGIETLVLDLLNGIDKEKYDVHIIILTNKKVRLVASLDTKVTKHIMNYNPEKLRSFLGLISGFVNLIKILKNINADIVHNHVTSTYLMFIMLAMRVSGFKSIHVRTIHTTGDFYAEQKSITDKLRLLSEKIIMRVIQTNLISVSNNVYKNNIFYFKNIVKDIITIPNGVNFNKYNQNNFKHISKNDFQIEEDKLVISYVARIENGKNHDLLINIFEEVIKEIPHAILTIAGNGSLLETLKQKVKEKNIEKNIMFLGSIHNVPELLYITDIGVFPSSFEGFSLVMLEKLAMKLPVVASDIEAFRSIVIDQKSAFLVSLENKKKFTECIVSLCKDEKLREKIGEQGYISIQKFSIENTIRKHDEYYVKCIKKGNK